MGTTEQVNGVERPPTDHRPGTARRSAFRALAWLLSLWVLAMSVFGLAELVLMR